MDREGFRELLESRKLNEDQIEASIAMAERFEDFLAAQGDIQQAISTWKFCKILIQEGKNTYDNLLAVGRYGIFIKSNAIYVAILEVLDGAEVQPNLYQKVGMLFGERIRDEVFAGIGISPMGLPPAEKPFDMFPVIDRLISKLGYEQVENLLSACLRDLPEEYYLDDREKYIQLADIDEYLSYKHESLVKRLETCQQEGKLFFSQEINDDVVQYVRERPETESGVRQGNLLYISKIPYDTIRFLAESDPTLKRYYACHCPWVRQAIKLGNIKLNPVFCNCSGGFSKRPWEVIFGETLKMEVLESVLQGDLRCRFVVYLPEKAGFTRVA
jgi:hypothetical protein